jgi:hypothetical protein
MAMYDPKANTADEVPIFEDWFQNPAAYTNWNTGLTKSHLILQYSRPLVGGGEML